MQGRLIGLAALLLGLGALYIAPVSTVSCARHDGRVSCRVEQAILGIVPRHVTQVDEVLSAGVDSNAPFADPGKNRVTDAEPNKTYHLAFLTPRGRVAPRGLDDSDTSALDAIVQQIDELENGSGSPFTQRTYDTLPIVVGLIFSVIGIGCLIYGS